MKKIIYVIVILSFVLFSCDGVLDKEPLDIIADNVVWDDPVLVDAYMLQVYSEIPFSNWRWNNNEINLYTQLSDEGRGSYTWASAFLTYKPGLLEETGGMDEWWGYHTMRKINEFFVQIENSTLDNNDKDVAIAKMKFARAFAYFSLVKRYGGVPIITKPQDIDAPEEELYVSRNKEVEVYDFILNELDEAIPVLPKSYSAGEKGWPTKYAALAMKSRVALYAASIAKYGENAPSTVQSNGLTGIPASEANRFWQESYDASTAIINSGKFELFKKVDDKSENYAQLFLTESGNPEMIFTKDYDGGLSGLGHAWDNFEFPAQLSGYAGCATAVYLEMVNSYEEIDGSYKPLTEADITAPMDLKDFFQNKDPRFHASILYEGCIFQDQILENWGGLIKPDGTMIDGAATYNGIVANGKNYAASQGRGNGADATGFNLRKFCDPTQMGPSGLVSTVDYPVFRYAEILLNHAEAALELDKPNGEVLEDINLIRDRAGIKLLSGIVTMDQVRHERKIELFSEGHRIWDLKRWRIAETAITRQFSGIHTFYDAGSGGDFVVNIDRNVDAGKEATFLPRHYYYPITPGRIANNSNLAPENPGY